MNEEPVTIFKTFSLAEAQLIRSRLEVSGFNAVVTHELAALSMEGYSQSTGGVRVEVPANEAEEARAFLESGHAQDGDSPSADVHS
jgi:hypothetical protein